MNKTELVAAVADELDLPKKSVAEVLDVLTDVISSTDRVTINGFGVFKQTERAAKTGRNPGTGEVINIPAKTVLTFKQSKVGK